MGLILDTCVLIASERRGGSIKNILQRAKSIYGEVSVAISAVTVVELTHGIYRAKTALQKEQRRTFTEATFEDLIVHPLSLEIAKLAGKIEGELAAQGISITFEDLAIGATALHLGYEVATQNVKHFEVIPALKIVPL